MTITHIKDTKFFFVHILLQKPLDIPCPNLSLTGDCGQLRVYQCCLPVTQTAGLPLTATRQCNNYVPTVPTVAVAAGCLLRYSKFRIGLAIPRCNFSKSIN